MNASTIEYDKDEYGIPEHMIPGLRRYVEKGVLGGGFLRAVLENDLQMAVGRADLKNRKALTGYVKLLYNQFPADAWGSPEKVKAWVEQGGLEGMRDG